MYTYYCTSTLYKEKTSAMKRTVKEFAEKMGCGESIIYRHIRNHKEELEGSVSKEGNKTYLSDEAQAFLEELMYKKPLQSEELLEEIKYLKERNNVYFEKKFELDREIVNKKTEIANLNQLVGELRERNRQLSDSIEGFAADYELKKDKLEKERAQFKERVAALQAQIDDLTSRNSILKAKNEQLTADLAAAEKDKRDIYRKYRTLISTPLTWIERLTGRIREIVED